MKRRMILAALGLTAAACTTATASPKPAPEPGPPIVQAGQVGHECIGGYYAGGEVDGPHRC
jgi:hypothetical protein